MNLFEPQLTLFREKKKGHYSLLSVTMTPHGCFFADRVVPGTPSGVIVIPEAIPIQLLIGERRAVSCPMVVTPVTHRVPDVRFTAGKSSVVCFAVLNGAVVGSASISPAAAHRVHAAPAAAPRGLLALAPAGDGTAVSFTQALTIILNNVPDPGAFQGDTTMALRMLGVVAAPFSEALKDGIEQGLQGSFTIDRSEIDAAPGDSLNLCIQSVVTNAV